MNKVTTEAAQSLLADVREQALDPITREHYPDAASVYDTIEAWLEKRLPTIEAEAREQGRQEAQVGTKAGLPAEEPKP